MSLIRLLGWAHALSSPVDLLADANRCYVLAMTTRTGVLVPVALGTLLPILLLADIEVPNTFVNGVVADALQVNSNFGALQSAVDTLNIELGQIDTPVASGTYSPTALAVQSISSPSSESSSRRDSPISSPSLKVCPLNTVPSVHATGTYLIS